MAEETMGRGGPRVLTIQPWRPWKRAAVNAPNTNVVQIETCCDQSVIAGEVKTSNARTISSGTFSEQKASQYLSFVL